MEGVIMQKSLTNTEKANCRMDRLSEIVRPVFWGCVKTAIYEASDTKNVSLTHEKYRYDTAVNCRYKTIFFWCDKTQCILQC